GPVAPRPELPPHDEQPDRRLGARGGVPGRLPGAAAGIAGCSAAPRNGSRGRGGGMQPLAVLERRTEPDLLGAARRIGESLLAEAEEREDGSLHWGRGAGRGYEATEDSGPFNGRSGEALLFAA